MTTPTTVLSLPPVGGSIHDRPLHGLPGMPSNTTNHGDFQTAVLGRFTPAQTPSLSASPNLRDQLNRFGSSATGGLGHPAIPCRLIAVTRRQEINETTHLRRKMPAVRVERVDGQFRHRVTRQERDQTS